MKACFLSAILSFVFTFSSLTSFGEVNKPKLVPFNYNLLIFQKKSNVALESLIRLMEAFEKVFFDITICTDCTYTPALFQLQSAINDSLLLEVESFANSLKYYVKSKKWNDLNQNEVDKLNSSINYLLNPTVKMSFESSNRSTVIVMGNVSATMALVGHLRTIKDSLMKLETPIDAANDELIASSLTVRNLTQWAIEVEIFKKQFSLSAKDNDVTIREKLDAAKAITNIIADLNKVISISIKRRTDTPEDVRNYIKLLQARRAHSLFLDRSEFTLNQKLNSLIDSKTTNNREKLIALREYLKSVTQKSRLTKASLEQSIVGALTATCDEFLKANQLQEI
ncbi:MAG: hypothetical protein H6625_01390 [Bdellovibrionaceae bacterium]|nr:hypothetical protein [Pseudobdellovibrionaceae bacterium]